MRWQRILMGASIALVLATSPTFAQSGFTCGSTGANGALAVAGGETLTLDIPDDGVFNFTTVTVSGTLRFNRNARFNPPVSLLATGDVIVNVYGLVQVDGSNGSSNSGGQGGPGGFDGGTPAAEVPGAGHGPGAGGANFGSISGGNAAYGGAPFDPDPSNGVPYGSPLLVPLVGGSGGGGGTVISQCSPSPGCVPGGGGGGGGAILLCSPTRVTVNGNVQAAGGNSLFYSSGKGSGGAIRIVSPSVRGNGSLKALSESGGSYSAGAGRIRIDAIEWSGLPSSNPPASLGSYMAVSAGTKLHIVQVAGNNIAPGTPSPLAFTLPPGSLATQSITVRAEGFTGLVPIAVVITPEAGDRTIVNTEINADVSPMEATVQVDLPLNVTVWVNAWTR